VTHVVVVGNEKGGSGKSTATMHIIVALMKSGFKVAAGDLDMRQKSLTRYIENRKNFCDSKNVEMTFPVMPVVNPSVIDSREESRRKESEDFASTLSTLGECDFVVIDCPGADTHLSRLAHAHADTIVRVFRAESTGLLCETAFRQLAQITNGLWVRSLKTLRDELDFAWRGALAIELFIVSCFLWV